jgi:hypothetical protein
MTSIIEPACIKQGGGERFLRRPIPVDPTVRHHFLEYRSLGQRLKNISKCVLWYIVYIVSLLFISVHLYADLIIIDATCSSKLHHITETRKVHLYFLGFSSNRKYFGKLWFLIESVLYDGPVILLMSLFSQMQ